MSPRRWVAYLVTLLMLAAGLAAPASAHNPHRVERGETVSGIAARHDQSIRRMKVLQPRKLRNPGLIYPGMRLRTHGKATKAQKRAFRRIHGGGKPSRRPDRNRAPRRRGRSSACGGPRNQFRLPVRPSVVSQHFAGQYPQHSGIDLAGPYRSPVRASARGRVVAVYHLTTSYGVYVKVQHACGIQTLYAHLDSENVFLGERVRRGEIIGRRDSTGNSTGHHLHYEVMTNSGFRLNPAGYLRGIGGAESHHWHGQDSGEALLEPGDPRPADTGGRGGGRWAGLPKRHPHWSVWWYRVAQCESSGRWHINTGNGYYGGLQFWPPTWREHGGRQFAAWPHRATARQQKRVAERVLTTQGIGAWPVCGRRPGVLKR